MSRARLKYYSSRHHLLSTPLDFYYSSRYHLRMMSLVTVLAHLWRMSLISCHHTLSTPLEMSIFNLLSDHLWTMNLSNLLLDNLTPLEFLLMSRARPTYYNSCHLLELDIICHCHLLEFDIICHYHLLALDISHHCHLELDIRRHCFEMNLLEPNVHSPVILYL